MNEYAPIKLDGATVLDRMNHYHELSKSEAEEEVGEYYKYIRDSIEENKKKKPESGYIELDVFVERATGMVYQLLLIPSRLTREVPWTVAQIGLKPDEGVEKYITLSQEERKKEFVKQIVNIEAIHYIDHGYGSGIPAEKVVIDGLATDKEMPKMNSKDLFVMLMTKGSGATYVDSKNDVSRKKLPKYDMDATFAQLAEATFAIDGYLANSVRDYYINNPITNNFTKHSFAKILLDLAEIKSGTWASNRGVSTVGHSMAGWETLRAYLAEVYRRFTYGMEKYNDQIVESSHISKRIYSSVYKEIMHNTNSELKEKVEKLLGVISKNSGIFISDIADSQIILRDEVTDDSDDTLRSVLGGCRQNMLYEAMTPLIKGKNVDRDNISNIRDEPHTLLTSAVHAPELRMIIGLRKIFGVIGGQLGYNAGRLLKILDRGVSRLVEDSAYGVDMIRATHAIGLGVGLDAVLMDDEVLCEAPNLLPDSRLPVTQFSVVGADGNYGRISRIRIHSGGKDPVLKTKHMEECAMAMVSGADDVYEKHATDNGVYEEHAKDSHYLSRETLSMIWTEIFARRNAVVTHRNKMVDLIARSFNMTI